MVVKVRFHLGEACRPGHGVCEEGRGEMRSVEKVVKREWKFGARGQLAMAARAY